MSNIKMTIADDGILYDSYDLHRVFTPDITVECPECGQEIVEDQIRNACTQQPIEIEWECDNCLHEFSTFVQLQLKVEEFKNVE